MGVSFVVQEALSIALFSCKLGVTFALEVELVGTMTTIVVAYLKGWHKLWIESDSNYIVAFISSRSS